MLLYRLALQRIIEYLNLDQIFKEDEHRLLLLQRKPKAIYKTALKTDQTLNFYLSVLLSIIGVLVCLTVPFAALEAPCEIFRDKEIDLLYNLTKWLEKNLFYIDCLIVLFGCLLILVAASTVIDAIRNTNISISPWVERGKYSLPPHVIRRLRAKNKNQ